MKYQSVLLVALLAGFQLPAGAADAAPLTVKEVEARYASDKKLCAEESTSAIRMQCLRDAKSEYTSALDAAKKAAAPAPVAKSASTAACVDCGKVLGVEIVERKGEGSALGMVGGGVAGALLGNQFGKGTGKTLATVAGAAGGAYAGKKVEEHVKTAKVWVVKVRFDSGDVQSYEFEQDPGMAAGDPVRKSGETIARR